MVKFLIYPLLILFLIHGENESGNNLETDRQWSQYRGNMSSGYLDQVNLPETFDIKSGKNVKWKKEIPGLGLSSPVIWGDKLFITTAISDSDKKGLKPGLYGDIGSVSDDSEHQWIIYCINKNTGEIIWERVSFTGIPEQKRHPKSSHANCTVATDGKYVVTFFGSEGLFCYDMEGNLIWEKDFGVLRSVFFRVEAAEWEFSSSPIIYDGKVIVQCDVMENSFVAAYDILSGDEIWKTDRDEYPGWCTPNIYKDGDKVRVAVNGYKHRGGYDFETGEEIWRMSGGGDIPVPTPINGNNLIYFNSAHGPDSPILAVKNNAAGDITLEGEENKNEFIEWSIPRGGSYMHTLLLYEGLIYNMKWNGRLMCYKADTGEEVYNEKIGKSDSFVSSPVAADGRIYIVSENGIIYVVQSGKEFKILSNHDLNDICMTTPAITDKIIFFRTQPYLYAVSKE